MRLLKVKVSGYRRLRDPNSLSVNEDLIAIVGPNEAGKTSLLHAISRLGDDDEIVWVDATRRSGMSPMIEAIFRLDGDERAELDELHDGSTIRRATLRKEANGRRTWALDEPPHRDPRPRSEVREVLEGLRDLRLLDNQFAHEERPWRPERYEAVLEILESVEDQLSADQLEELHQLVADLNILGPPREEEAQAEQGLADSDIKQLTAERERVAAASQQLNTLRQIESAPTPAEVAESILFNWLPEFLFFDVPDRELASSHELTEPRSRALQHLARLANLNLDELVASVQREDPGHVAGLIQRANERLAEVFADEWSQSGVHVSLDNDHTELYVLAGGEAPDEDGTPNYHRITEHSAGLNWFVALRAFVAERGDAKPIVLIDEAETHLHYDAQADLVDVLERQQLASKIIYTTHSVGCLPHDLGLGVRAVVPTETGRDSDILNTLWTSRAGLSPLLVAMGASALSFSALRFAVFVEGRSDAILLPTLFRLATGLDRLPYRIAPGLTLVPDELALGLDLEAARSAFLVDGDTSGTRISERLRSIGIPARRIQNLGTINTRGATLEDFVSPAALVDAFNQELQQWDTTPDRVRVSDLRGRGHAAALDEWCEARSIAWSKVDVAQRLVSMWRERDLSDTPFVVLAPGRTRRLTAIHKKIVSAMGIDDKGA